MSVRRLHAIQPESFVFNAENMSWAKQVIAKYPAGKQASAVIPLLWRAQEQNDNWVSKPVIEYIADMLELSYIRVLEVATFYTMFQLQPVGRKAHIQVCGTTPCMLRGAEDLKRVCQNRIHHDQHHISPDGDFSWEEVECLGACVNAPMVQIFKDTYEDLTPASFEKLIDDVAAGRKVKVGPQIDRHLAAPVGGTTTLNDPELYKGNRGFTRVEAPPPAPPAAPAAPATAAPAAPATAAAPVATPAPALVVPPAAAPAAPVAVVSTVRVAPSVVPPPDSPVVVPPGTPAPAAVVPKPEDIRPVTPAARAVEAKREEAEQKAQASPDPGSPMEGKAQRETNVTRATTQEATDVAPVKSAADLAPKSVVNEKPPEPVRSVEAKPEPARVPKAKPVPEPKPMPVVKPMAEVTPVQATAPKAPEPIKLSEQKVQPARKPAADGKPELLKKPRGGKPDDLKLIWGVGPKLEEMLNAMGVWHFDQVASWTAKEIAWVDDRLEGFKGRAKRDDWVKQSKKLSSGWRPDNAVGEKPKKK